MRDFVQRRAGELRTEVAPEYINSYEVGYKQTRPQVSIDIDAFYYDYDDIQLPISVSVNGILEPVINAPKAEIERDRISEGTWNPIPDLLITGTILDYTPS